MYVIIIIMYFCKKFKLYILQTMDTLSTELQNFLELLASKPDCVSEKIEHYVKHILHLLSVNDENLLIRYYGLFGNKKTPLDELAHTYGISAEALLAIIEMCLRKLAITPEWQMIKQFANASSPA